MKKYLITGGAGFIGSNFVHFLFSKEEEIEIVVLDKLTYSSNLSNLEKFKNDKRFTFVKGDICDPIIVKEVVQNVNVIVNFAAEVSVDRAIENPDAFLYTDIFGVHNLLKYAKINENFQMFIQISTDEVYGQIFEGSFYENSELKPRNPYAASKLGGERLAYSYFATYNIPIIITRASNNYGPMAYLEKVIPLFITNLIDNQKIPIFGDGLQIRDWLHVHDHCRAIYHLINFGKIGEVYNIGGNEEIKNIELAKKLITMLNKTEDLIKFVNDRPSHDFRYSLNCDKIKKLGWMNSFNIEKGLINTIEWYKNNENWWRPIKQNMDLKYFSGLWGEKK